MRFGGPPRSSGITANGSRCRRSVALGRYGDWALLEIAATASLLVAAGFRAAAGALLGPAGATMSMRLAGGAINLMSTSIQRTCVSAGRRRTLPEAAAARAMAPAAIVFPQAILNSVSMPQPPSFERGLARLASLRGRGRLAINQLAELGDLVGIERRRLDQVGEKRRDRTVAEVTRQLPELVADQLGLADHGLKPLRELLLSALNAALGLKPFEQLLHRRRGRGFPFRIKPLRQLAHRAWAPLPQRAKDGELRNGDVSIQLCHGTLLRHAVLDAFKTACLKEVKPQIDRMRKKVFRAAGERAARRKSD